MKIRVRFAPSPTGYLHIGGARTALFNWMFARKHGGDFILRIEDTDQKRFVPGAVANLMASLRWLGLEWDEGPDVGGPYGPYIQSERNTLYRKWADWLLQNDYAYKDYTTRDELTAMRAEQKAQGLQIGYDRRHRDLSDAAIAAFEDEGRPYTVRFKAPLTGETVVHDLIRGDILFDNSHVQDMVLLKSDGLPTYHLANVIDDHFMAISHIMRADEWISTAPLHSLLYQAFGWEMPQIAHLPVILSPSGRGKLSKRDQAFEEDGLEILVQTLDYDRAGYLPQAVVNWLANIGWNYGDDVEIFDIEDAVPRFTLPAINPAPTRLPFSKLEWLNGQYIQQMGDLELAQAVKPYVDAAAVEVNATALLALAPVLKPRLKKLSDVVDQVQFLDDQQWRPDPNRLTHKKLPAANALVAFAEARHWLLTHDDFEVESLGEALRAIGEEHTLNNRSGPFLGTMRYAITGRQVSPPLFESIMALGQSRSVARLQSITDILTAAQADSPSA